MTGNEKQKATDENEWIVEECDITNDVYIMKSWCSLHNKIFIPENFCRQFTLTSKLKWFQYRFN